MIDPLFSNNSASAMFEYFWYICWHKHFQNSKWNTNKIFDTKEKEITKEIQSNNYVSNNKLKVCLIGITINLVNIYPNR